MRRFVSALVLVAVAATPVVAEYRITGADLPRLVALAERGDAGARIRLDRWAAAVRAGDPGALASTAAAMTDGIAADEARIREAERHAAAGGWDARTEFVRSVAAGATAITPVQAAEFAARLPQAPSVRLAAAVIAPLRLDTEARLLQPAFEPPNVDPGDVAVEEIAEDEAGVSATTATRSVCKRFEYADRLFGYVVMGLEVCIRWNYDRERYVSNGSRAITPFVTLWGGAHSWRWVGTNVADHKYFNYRRTGAKSGYHTRTIGHFQHCTVQVVVPTYDQDVFPHLSINGHFDGTSAWTLTP